MKYSLKISLAIVIIVILVASFGIISFSDNNKAITLKASKVEPKILSNNLSNSSLNWMNNSYFDVMHDHNQILDYIEALEKDNLMDKRPKILINFDSHSDTYHNNSHIEKGEDNSGNWVNQLMSKGIIDEYYWVQPILTEKNTVLVKTFWKENAALDKYFINSASKFDIYRNLENNHLIFNTSVKNTGNYSVIKFTKTKSSDLPDFSSQNKQIILSIDADYFANANEEPLPIELIDETELNSRISEFLETIKSKGILPTIVACSVSPLYLSGFQTNLEAFFNILKAHSLNQNDYLQTYTRSEEVKWTPSVKAK
jgi:hypothetical protein